MPDRIDELFGDDEVRYYPGSTTPIPAADAPRKGLAKEEVEWDAKPLVYVINGIETEFFTIGAVAKALGKSSNTVREWERTGIIPKARFRTPSVDPKKTKRLYTRAQVEGIVVIAKEEGVTARKPVRILPSFTAKIVALFVRLESPGNDS